MNATRSLAAERTVVVLIDDLHFAPEEGRALFASLALAVPGHRVLLVGTSRPPLDEKWASEIVRAGHATRRPVGRLGAKDLVVLLEDALKSARLAEELSHRIAKRTDGNPFFVFEVLRGLKDGQFLTQKPDGTWATTAVIRDIAIPSSVLDLVKARVADLEEEERDLLDVAACCGYEFDPALVGDVLGLARIPALKRFGQIERKHRLVRAAGRKMIFDHHQVQEALYASLLEPLREEYHAAIADALEARLGGADADPAATDGERAVDLAEHFLLGAAGDRALRWLDAAMAHLGKGYVNDRAIRLAERALAAPGLLAGPERARLLLRIAAPNGPLDLLGRRDRQETAAREAEEIATEAGDEVLRARAASALGTALFQTGRYPEAEETYRRALGIHAKTGDRAAQADAAATLAQVLLPLGRTDEAREHLEGALAIALETGDRRAEAAARARLGNALLGEGRLEEAAEELEAALPIAREIGDRRGEATATVNLGVVLRHLGRPDEARATLQACLAISREIGDRRTEGAALGNLGNVVKQTVGPHAAREFYEAALEISRELGDRRRESTAELNLGIVGLQSNDFGSARRHFEVALAIGREIGDRQGTASALVNLGKLLAELGQTEVAREMLGEAASLCRDIGALQLLGYALESLCLACEQAGDRDAARRLFEEALAGRRELGFLPGIASTQVSLARLDALDGDDEGAAARLDEAEEIGRMTGDGETLVFVAVERSRLPGADPASLEAFAVPAEEGEVPDFPELRFRLWEMTGDAAHLARAKFLLDDAVAKAPPDCRESIVENIPVHRAVAAAAAAES